MLPPDSRHGPRATEYVRLLDRMIREDQAHAARGPVDLDKLSVHEQVDELIFLLRDQLRCDWLPGDSHLTPLERADNSPAGRLVKIGPPAIPQLIAALDDRRLTGSLNTTYRFRDTRQIAIRRVGDCVLAIINDIAAMQFSHAELLDKRPPSRPASDVVRKEILDWWAAFRKKGERQVLIETTQRGEYASVRTASRLVQKYPTAAADVLIEALANRMGRWRHDGDELIELLGRLKGTRVTAALRKLLHTSKHVELRVRAAVQLLKRGENDVVAEVIRLWKRHAAAHTGKSATRRRQADADDLRCLARFLIQCRHPDAIMAVAGRIGRLGVRERLHVVEMLSQVRRPPWFDVPAVDLTDADSAAADAAIEKLLIGRLMDDSREARSSRYIGNEWIENLTIADEAAQALSELWPKTYEFDVTATWDRRDAMHTVMRKQFAARPASRPATRDANR